MIIRISILGICVCILSVILKGWLREAVLPLQISFAAITIAVIFESIKDITDKLKDYIGASELSYDIFSSLLKGAMICTVAKLVSDAAKDSGNSLVSDVVELTGRIMLLSLGFPFIENVIKTAVSFLP